MEVTLLHIPGTTFLKAKNLKVTRNKRELAMAAQIDQMLAAGLTREQGIIETIKGEYGFIKPADRADQIYFKLDDIPAEKGKPEEVKTLAFNFTNVFCWMNSNMSFLFLGTFSFLFVSVLAYSKTIYFSLPANFIAIIPCYSLLAVSPVHDMPICVLCRVRKFRSSS